MVVLGIDPGLASVGWSVVKGTHKSQKLIDYGVITTTNKSGFDTRLHFIFEEVKHIIETCEEKPTIAAMEELFFAKNAKTAIKVGQAIGVIKLACFYSNLEIVEYTPLNIKTTITGYGNADKDQVTYMVSQTLGIKEKISPDHAADAAAIALTHLFTNKSLLNKEL